MSDPRDGFLGTLRSELDEGGDVVHPAFEALSALVSVARGAFLSRHLDPDAAARLMATLRLTGSDGHEWTVGATSGTWFRRPVGTRQWQPSASPLGVSLSPGDAPDWLATGIDGYLAEHAAATSTRVAEEAPAGLAAFDSVVEDGPAPVQPAAPVRAVDFDPRARDKEDTDWLLEEWGGDLRPASPSLTSTEGPAGTGAELPAALPEDWDADVQLTRALDAPGEIAAREGSAPLDPQWEPVDRDEYLSPESLFLPPD